MGYSFVSFTAKEYLEKWHLLLLLQTFQLWISTSTALNTSPLWRYYTHKRGGVYEGCNSLSYWI